MIHKTAETCTHGYHTMSHGARRLGKFYGNHAQNVGRNFNGSRMSRRTVHYLAKDFNSAFIDQQGTVAFSYDSQDSKRCHGLVSGNNTLQ